MDINNEKEVKEYILDLEDEYLSHLPFVLNNAKNTSVISGMFNALYMLLKKYPENALKINYLVNLIQNYASIAIANQDAKKIQKISNLLKSLTTKINKNFTKKEKIKINEIYSNFQILFNALTQAQLNKKSGRSK